MTLLTFLLVLPFAVILLTWVWSLVGYLPIDRPMAELKRAAWAPKGKR